MAEDKISLFRHHPVRIEQGLFMGLQQLDIVAVRLAMLDAVLTSPTGVNSTGWLPLDIRSLVVAKGGIMPYNAIAVILDVEVSDTNPVGAATYMEFAGVEHNYLGVPAGKIQTVYCGNVTDRKHARLIVAQLSYDGRILCKITASGAVFAYTIKLVGWLIGGTRIDKEALPYAELLAKFTI